MQSAISQSSLLFLPTVYCHWKGCQHRGSEQYGYPPVHGTGAHAPGRALSAWTGDVPSIRLRSTIRTCRKCLTHTLLNELHSRKPAWSLRTCHAAEALHRGLRKLTCRGTHLLEGSSPVRRMRGRRQAMGGRFITILCRCVCRCCLRVHIILNELYVHAGHGNQGGKMVSRTRATVDHSYMRRCVVPPLTASCYTCHSRS